VDCLAVAAVEIHHQLPQEEFRHRHRFFPEDEVTRTRMSPESARQLARSASIVVTSGADNPTVHDLHLNGKALQTGLRFTSIPKDG
jgi:hypothetical protein